MKQVVRKMSVFSKVKAGAPIEVFERNTACLKDTFKDKVNLTVGAYKDEEGQPWVLPVVKKAKCLLQENPAINHEYTPAEGMPEFRKVAAELLLGANSSAIKDGRALPIQSLSGTGALRIGAEFLARIIGREVFYYSDPTWEAHANVFLSGGFKTGKKYRYWDSKTLGLDMEGFVEDLCQAPKGAVIILHGSAHNPTGTDPTKEQWEQIADIIEERELFPFFDVAYQGFASGDPDSDAYSVRYFTDRCMELFCAQSFSKNFGLYGERVGNLTMVQADSKTTQAVQSRIALVIRGMYSNPPSFGCRLVTIILSDPTLRQEWLDCINLMSTRIKKMRKALFENVTNMKTPGNWDHLINQIGMFCFTGLNPQQVKMLTDEFHIYLMGSGRINMCGLNDKNVQYVAKAINAVVTKIKS